jgi:uncharacterized membrane protein
VVVSMDAILLEWGGLLLRWLHIIAGICWIGSSFYFTHIDASLKASPEIPKDKGGHKVHGGGFYEIKKYLVAPEKLPPELIWHNWEAYTTWISGFFLLVWVYYFSSELYLIDPAVRQIPPFAGAIGIVSLVIGWIVYDQLCKSTANIPKDVDEIILSRCSMCHAHEPVWAGLAMPPKGILLETPDQIVRAANEIRVQAVLTTAMPPDNNTQMTQDERRALAAWIATR